MVLTAMWVTGSPVSPQFSHSQFFPKYFETTPRLPSTMDDILMFAEPLVLWLPVPVTVPVPVPVLWKGVKRKKKKKILVKEGEDR